MLAVKLFSWEHAMLSHISTARVKELQFVKRFAYTLAVIISVFTSTSCLMSIAAFSTYAALGHELTPGVVFPTLYLFEMLNFPLIEFPYCLSLLAATETAFKRILVWDVACFSLLL